ncbi:uncharacterized protein si:dkey-154b15.1 [Toxotes jaculatrix]|uniref:uncharacterized protein si:dkey-154b15.1 n=1 Tax=Toxotes jaculatrix TaxID=941984 RepID=UPI001B3B11BD|nr:uncharacterized protein si:dkey-154b15.1 [Toxotes jaculatrix]
MLRVNQQRHFIVKTAECPEMDFTVEATIHLNLFRDETKVREILRSQDFEMRDLGRNQVRVRGSFWKLKCVRVSLEQLLNSQTQTKTTPFSSSPVQTVSSKAISTLYTNNGYVSHGNRGRLESRDKALRGSPSSPNNSASWVSNASHNPPSSPEYRASSSPRADQRASLRHGSESFVVDADVFKYAEQLRTKYIHIIQENHNVEMEVHESGDSSSITLLGKSARVAVSKLQDLLDDLSKSLRTQDVPRTDIDHKGEALLEAIRENRGIYSSVLVCEMNDRLHLIGPSVESYELKQKLLGRPVDQSQQRTGRTLKKNPRGRSSSLPPMNRKNTGDGGAIANRSPAGAAGYSPSKPVAAAGYSPSKYQDNEQEVAKPEQRTESRLGQNGALGRRSRSESRGKKREERPDGFVQEKENKQKSPKSLLQPLLSVNTNIRQRLKKLRK